MTLIENSYGFVVITSLRDAFFTDVFSLELTISYSRVGL